MSLEELSQKKVCKNCGVVCEPAAEKCPDCGDSNFSMLRNLPPVIGSCTYFSPDGKQCEKDAARISKDGRKVCEDHYMLLDLDLRDHLQEIADALYHEDGRDAPRMTDEQIIKAFSSGIKQRIRSTQYGRDQRKQFREAKSFLEELKVRRAKLAEAQQQREEHLANGQEQPQDEVETMASKEPSSES